MLKAVIFDFDGVLAESVDIKTEAFAKLFEPEGPEAVDAVVRYHLEHGGVSRFEKFRYMYREVLKRPLPEGEFDSLCRKFEQLVLEGVIAAPEVNGATECLKGLKGKAKLFIVSGTPVGEIRLIAKARKIEHFFDGIYGSPEGKAELIRKVLGAEGLDPGEVVFVGDSMTDYEAAMETGTGFIARATHETEEFWRRLKVRVVSDIAECMREIGLG
jgi:HAD superfamily hydrolase (TIGR01549 family)